MTKRELGRLLAAALAGAILCLVIALAYGYASHQPQPRDVRIAVAAPPAVRAHVVAGLDRAVPGGFRVSAATAGGALRAVRQQGADGAFILSSGGRSQIVTAAAGGVTQQLAIEQALGAVAAHAGLQTQLVDVAPLPAGDRGGQSSFVFALALLVPSVLGAVGLFLAGARMRLWWRVLAALVFGVVASAAALLVMGPVLGALTHAPLAMLGFGALGAFTFTVVALALQAIFGLPGTGIAALVFLFVGNSMSGGTVPRSFLPDGFRQISKWLPNAAVVQLTRSANYFGTTAIGHSLAVLGIWSGCALAVIATVDVLQRAAVVRSRASEGEAYAASALSYLTRRATDTEVRQAS